MQSSEVLALFEESGAILKGHFILSSGLHSDTYLQCARVLMNAQRAGVLCAALAQKIRKTLPEISFDMVVAPAMGGVVVGYEMGRQLALPSIFCERVDGNFTLRRGFDIPKGAKVLIVEDVVTTGKSSLETVECIKANGGIPVAEACLIDRSGGKSELGIPLISLVALEVKTFTESSIPSELASTPAVKPGSRWLQAKK